MGSGYGAEIARPDPVFALEGDDRRRFHPLPAAWCGAAQAVVAALAPVPFAIFEAAIARAAGNVCGKAGHGATPANRLACSLPMHADDSHSRSRRPLVGLTL